MANHYQTLIEFEGEPYIKVSEHESIVKDLLDFQTKVIEVQDAFKSLESSTRDLGINLLKSN